MPKFLNERLSSLTSFVPAERPIPIMGPIRGEISIAPIITAVEFTLSPIEAINIEQIKIQILGPLKTILLVTSLIVPSKLVPSRMLNRACKNFLRLLKKLINVDLKRQLVNVSFYCYIILLSINSSYMKLV